ncbi:MAG: LemA family protein [Gemmatimonadaceae bacterium]|nr:LemA family protein [Gemmatimonadaceae bacterium]
MSGFSKLYLVVAIPVLLSGCGYNTIQRYDEQAAQAKQQIDVQLQRRADLVPNLVATVKGYAKQEETIFIEVARARSGLLSAIQSGDPGEAAAANAQLTGALGRLLVTVEAYPQLKSDQNFLRLQDELAGTENRIAVARTDYNAAVNQYNAYIRTLPQKLTAMVTGAKPREYFNAPGAAETPPQVDFTRP